jgi:hypothetical protein
LLLLLLVLHAVAAQIAAIAAPLQSLDVQYS